MPSMPIHGPCVRSAARFGWASWQQLSKLPKMEVEPGMYELMYRNSPYFAMLTRGE